jgi:hypothetical protein
MSSHTRPEALIASAFFFAQEAEALTPKKNDIVDYHGYFRQVIYALHAGMARKELSTPSSKMPLI